MSARAILQFGAAALAYQLAKAWGATVVLTNRGNDPVTLSAFPREESVEEADVLGLRSEASEREIFVPQQPGCFARITRRSLTTNVVTITTALAHGLKVGMQARIRGDVAHSTFDGLHLIVSVPSSTTFTYAKTAGNVAEESAPGAVEAVPSLGDLLEYDGATYSIRRTRVDSIRSGWVWTLRREQVKRAGALG